MFRRGHISKDDYETAISTPLALKNVEKGKSEADAWESISEEDVSIDANVRSQPEEAQPPDNASSANVSPENGAAAPSTEKAEPQPSGP